MLHKFSEKLRTRGKRSGIIYVSSMAAQAALPTSVVYSAAKCFGKWLLSAIEFESKSSGEP